MSKRLWRYIVNSRFRAVSLEEGAALFSPEELLEYAPQDDYEEDLIKQLQHYQSISGENHVNIKETKQELRKQSTPTELEGVRNSGDEVPSEDTIYERNLRDVEA